MQKNDISKEPINLKCSIYIVSTSRFQKIRRNENISDESGETAIRLLESKGVKVIKKNIIKDGIYYVKEALKESLRGEENLILFIGGTGVSKSDFTIDAVKPFIEKELPGFGELFRNMSFDEIGTSSIMSRAIMGVTGKKIIVALPGSTSAVKLALERIILPELKHVYKLITRDRH